MMPVSRTAIRTQPIPSQVPLMSALTLAAAIVLTAPAAFAQTTPAPQPAPSTEPAPAPMTMPDAAPSTAPATGTAPEPRPADAPATAPATATAPEPKPADAAMAGASAAAAPDTSGLPSATAAIANAEGQSVGTATITDTPSGMLHVTIALTGMPEGVFASHIHTTGQCEGATFESAGGHLTGGHEHGVMAAGGSHQGDLPNLHVPAGGALTVETFKPDTTVADVLDSDGGAIMIHTQADDYATQPTGDAGGRMACGVFASP